MFNNLLSGLVLILGGNVQQNNWVEVGNVAGRVESINIRCTVIETTENALVYVPNSSIINGQFINWTRNGKETRRKISFRTVYGTDIDKARRIMLEVAANNPLIKKTPAPSVAVNDLSENAVILHLAVTIVDIDVSVTAQSELREQIYKLFNENGIGFYVGSSLDVNVVEASK
jgi:small-conductance mechanosensitive channel